MHVSESGILRLICEWLIKTALIEIVVAIYTDNCGNSRANTCAATRLIGRVVFMSIEITPRKGVEAES